MNVRDLIPWNTPRRDRVPARRGELTELGGSPFLSLHREINRLFDDAFRGFDDLPAFARRASWPSVELKDSDNEVQVTAELPGMEEKDVDLTLHDGVLSIRGERREETVNEARSYSERYYGRFERRIPLGFEVDEDKVSASFKNGVLTVTLPKIEQTKDEAKRIPIGSG